MNVFLTGISSGLGNGLAKRLLLDGHCVYGVSRRPDTDPAIQDLKQIGNLTYFCADIAGPDNIPKIVARLRELGVTLDRVVINAAVIQHDLNDFFELDYEKMLESLQVNFLSSLVLVQNLLPLVRKEGAFVAISSLSVLCDLDPHQIGYPLSKISLNAFFDSLKLKLPNQPRFVVINLGRMEPEARGLFTISYDQAAIKIKRILSYRKCSGTYYFPLRVAVPGFAVGRLPLGIRKLLVANRRNNNRLTPRSIMPPVTST